MARGRALSPGTYAPGDFRKTDCWLTRGSPQDQHRHLACAQQARSHREASVSCMRCPHTAAQWQEAIHHLGTGEAETSRRAAGAMTSASPTHPSKPAWSLPSGGTSRSTLPARQHCSRRKSREPRRSVYCNSDCSTRTTSSTRKNLLDQWQALGLDHVGHVRPSLHASSG